MLNFQSPVEDNDILDSALHFTLQNLLPLAQPSAPESPPVAPIDLEGTCCIHLASLECTATDQQLFKRYSSLGAVDAFVVQDSAMLKPPTPTPLEKGQKVAAPAPAASTMPPMGFVVFRDSASAYSAVDRMAELGVKKWDVIITPQTAALRTPLGCLHRGCRTLMCILYHPALHTQNDTVDVLEHCEEPAHAAAILCSQRFLSTNLAPTIVRCPNLRHYVVKELLMTLLSDESSESYIQESIILLASLHQRNYIPSEPVVTLDSIVTQDVKLTKKILKGLCEFVRQLSNYFETINTQPTLVRIRARNVDTDGKDALQELCKLLRGNRPQQTVVATTPATPDTQQATPTTVIAPQKPTGASTPQSGPNVSSTPITPSINITTAPTTNGPSAANGTNGAAGAQTTTTTTNPSTPAPIVLSSKTTCHTCSGRAKFKCSLCDKAFCQDCYKYDEQIHECLSRTVYVSKVDPALSDKELRQFLDQCGTVSKVRLCGDPTQRSVYGFVEFTAPVAAQRLLQMDRHTVGANVLRCL
eukprot:PhF_6_TR5662/c1_g1_i1/m.8317